MGTKLDMEPPNKKNQQQKMQCPCFYTDIAIIQQASDNSFPKPLVRSRPFAVQHVSLLMSCSLLFGILLDLVGLCQGHQTSFLSGVFPGKQPKEWLGVVQNLLNCSFRPRSFMMKAGGCRTQWQVSYSGFRTLYS